MFIQTPSQSRRPFAQQLLGTPHQQVFMAHQEIQVCIVTKEVLFVVL